MKPYTKRMAHGAAALAMAAGLVVTYACTSDQKAQQAQTTAQQSGSSNTSNEALPPFAPEVADQPPTNYTPNIDPSNFVKVVDNPYFLARTWQDVGLRGQDPRGHRARGGHHTPED